MLLNAKTTLFWSLVELAGCHIFFTSPSSHLYRILLKIQLFTVFLLGILTLKYLFLDLSGKTLYKKYSAPGLV